jgi:hypothetical protein
MAKAELLKLLQVEIRRHDFDCFTDRENLPPGNRGVVVPGCPYCKKRIHTMSQYMDHLADDVLPTLFGVLESKP